MPWVPFEESALSAAWEFVDFGTDAYLHGSSVQVNSGIGRWAFNTYGTPGRVRITVVSYSTSSADADPAHFNHGMVQNEGGQFEWQPEVFELEISDNMTQLIYTPSAVGSSRQVETYNFLIEVFVDGPGPNPDPDPEGLVARDDEATTNADTPVTVDVLANDTYGSNPVQLSDLDGLPEIIQEPSSGTVEVLDDGRVVYTPAEGFTGEVEFQYRIKTPEPETCYNLSLDSGHLYDWNIEDSEIPGFIMGEEMYLINDVGIIYNYVYYSGSNYYAPTSDYPQCGTLSNWKIVFPRNGDYDDMVELCVNIENGCA